MTGTVAQRIANIRSQLPTSVRLIAVTKQVPVETMRAAYAAGLRDFGESRIQEAATKQAMLQDLPDITWHLIGHLQNNKAQKTLEQFHWIHSIDSLKLAQRLDLLAEGRSRKPQVLLQVKILRDPNKSGWTIPDIMADLHQLEQCRNLKIQGLMSIPPLRLETAEIENFFEQTAQLADRIRLQNWSQIQMQHLSMGMSNDYQLAVRAGATMVRLGRILFADGSNET
ncbi:MAG: YggS family pyridoxal phosphate-dependent enzyme [Hormoscilla sp. SP5CHS1]|nr:YggS family pyridoxal phosphate-dependent enzyme [Hormoscilla sp. SP12CHS1]MBC6454315.1 YggS family pyridoxal phosphate-dependent enzyme [Hormoscilla sp. SP5CHS1]